MNPFPEKIKEEQRHTETILCDSRMLENVGRLLMESQARKENLSMLVLRDHSDYRCGGWIQVSP